LTVSYPAAMCAACASTGCQCTVAGAGTRSHGQMDSTWSQHMASLTTAWHCSSSGWDTAVQNTGLKKSVQNALKCSKM